MALPSDFAFSQNNLQDYVDCARRFHLRHVQRQPWPALQTEPVQEHEHHMQLGERFHQLVHQHQLGLPESALERQAAEAGVAAWWQIYHDRAPQSLPVRRYPEFTLTAAFAGFRLLAKYDLLAVAPGERVIILDWKTGPRAQSAAYLHQRMQTRLYPFLVALAGACLNGNRPVLPDQVEMIYWFVCDPDQPVRLSYSQAQFEADTQYFERLVREIARRQPERFAMTLNEKACGYCTYRSLCGRGEQAANWLESEDDLDDGLASIDFDQIGEIRF